jgi:hypothetical protein
MNRLRQGLEGSSMTRSLHWTLVSRVLVEVSLCRHDCLNHQLCGWTQQHYSSTSQWPDWLKVPVFYMHTYIHKCLWIMISPYTKLQFDVSVIIWHPTPANLKSLGEKCKYTWPESSPLIYKAVIRRQSHRMLQDGSESSLEIESGFGKPL